MAGKPTMILARANRTCLVSCLVLGVSLAGTSARADVMEVGPDGARWVAGALASQSPAALDSGVELNGARVPDAVAGNEALLNRGVPAQYKGKIAELSQRYDLSPSLLEAVVWQESRWRANAVSHAGARGLAQLMPGTARDLGVDPDDPMQNLEGGARYLRAQLDRFDGDLEKALAAYNAGPARVARAGGIPKIRETQNYVAAILGRLASRSLVVSDR